jgi:hypothetical protein
MFQIGDRQWLIASEEASVPGLFLIQRLAIADRRFGTSLCTIVIDKEDEARKLMNNPG